MKKKQAELPSLEKEKNNAQLCANIDKMIDLIKDSFNKKGESCTKKLACEKLGITDTSLSRWRKGLTATVRGLNPLYIVYNQKFTPSIAKIEDLKEKDLTGSMRLIGDVAEIELFKLFCNSYYVYYYSDHSPEDIHFGRLKVFTEGNGICAKLVIGIPSLDRLKDDALNKVFERDADSFNMFNAYKNNLKRIDEGYCFYYYGSASLSDSMLVLTLFGRDKSNKPNDHKLIIYINIRKIKLRHKEIADMRPYYGGMSMAISMPNEKHPSLRIFKIGISKWEIPLHGLEALGPMLVHKSGVNQRIVLTEDDDRIWFHSIAKYQD